MNIFDILFNMKRTISYMKKQRLKDLKDNKKNEKELNKEIYTSLDNLLERLSKIYRENAFSTVLDKDVFLKISNEKTLNIIRKAYEIRNKLLDMGIMIKDTREGTVYEKL